MKTKKNAAAQQAATTTATEKKSSAKRTVKNNSKKAVAPVEPQEEEKKNRRSAAAKKAAETRRKNREEEQRRQEEENKRRAQEEAARRKAEDKKMKEAGSADKKDHNAHYSGAQKEVRGEKTPVYIFHSLNKMADGKKEAAGLNFNNLRWCYDDLENGTPTHHNYKGFSFDAVKVDSRGRVCKMVRPTGQEEISFYKYGIIRVDGPKGVDIDIIDTYQGYFLLIPVAVTEAGILTAAKTVTGAYKDIYNDVRNIYKTRTTRQAETERQEKSRRAAMKAAGEKADREKMKKEARETRERAEKSNTNIISIFTGAARRIMKSAALW